jgi:hypothetical protein
MQTDELHGAVAFTVIMKNDIWFVTLPDKTSIGPYYKAGIALQVAIIHALSARKRGLDAYIFVADNIGGNHKCMLMYNTDSPSHCDKCERAWSGSRHKLRCAMRSAINAR